MRVMSSPLDPVTIRAALERRRRMTFEPRELPGHRAAAVLVPLVVRDGEPHMVFTLRSASLRGHAGQVSFPGGAVDATDADRIATAIREADEEIGVEPGCVEVFGLLDEIPTPSGFLITPVLAALIPPPAAYRPNPAEVAEVFECSIARLSDPTVYEEQGEVERWGRRYRLCAYKPDGRNIWGATARMVAMVLELLRGREP
jgi:8-oxo-dGTP pyrophosphatase MutT (NUDIX family)